MSLEPQASLEIAQFLASGPTPEQIVAFHLSPETNERAYVLIDAERDGTISDEEREELESAVQFEHMMRLVKAEARIILKQRAS
jgi:hypothetical protein